MKRLILYLVLLSLTVVTGCTSTTTQPDSAASALARAHARVTENEAKLGIGESVPCLYTYCTSGGRLYWYKQDQHDSLDGDIEMWEGNRSASYEDKSGHPWLAVYCRAPKTIQAEIKTAGISGFGSVDAGILLENTEGIAKVRAKADGKNVVFNWRVSKDHQDLILNKSELRSLLKYKMLVLGLEDYDGATYRMVLQIPPTNKEMQQSCNL
jgi:hypothetical protein